MGICTSVPKNPDSKARSRFVASPAKGKKAFNGEDPVASFDFTFRSPGFGSKEETFFDSRGWLDSDCEDDFFSVKGDFTPSRGGTPVHPLSSPSTPRLDKDFFFHKAPDSQSEPSPSGRKKLAELLQETLQSERADSPDAAGEKGDTGAWPPLKSPNSATPNRSGAGSVCSNEGATTPSRKERAWKTSHCCLPRLQSFGLDEGHKLSPGPCAA